MGRHFEVRAAAMAGTAKKKSALYMRASKEIFVAAKSGVPDPASNLALRSAIDKFKGQGVPKDVIERAVSKAAGNDDQTAYISGRYEAMGPGGSMIVVDTLTDNVNRAYVEIKTVITKRGGHLASVVFNFTETGVFIIQGLDPSQVEETLILNDIDVWDVSSDEDGVIQISVAPTEFGSTRDQLQALGVEEFIMAEIRLVANDQVVVEDEEDLRKLKEMLELLDELQDVQAVYHNVTLSE
ncbi:MAG TPA: YebC/PmpR family DNA-binding transcriptional regulator [Bacilli bacterium]|jgi:YebC/PmpR family DNA-binding regulatory protein|nr:YebC/PmpR family DNA-binding transcriptional regulator [Bacilli bacterium]MDD3389286.1 YebC/PmpR family DNA-binding transcriptional regulator [Bacilli bacterium]MDD4344917.1 YebC/PmpR family DNA-binding transcriptional regulator [Bacilli bacterium]MDD4520726.1 YebC/PmpR family DNA-binding transcriptional regulator [Bacilli bacterium]MDY0399500.1 YebC/PmpR family DNA-binding transcriptional regulator [Bacilli bacterium]